MAGVTPLGSEYGTRQGRIEPEGVVPSEGSFVYVHGYDLPLHTAILGINDYIQIAQSATFTAGTKIFRMRVRLRSPVAMPTGVQWIFTLIIDGVERTRRTLRPRALRDLIDLAANVANIGGGAHSVALRLQLVTG